MAEPGWNCSSAPEEGAVVYVLAEDDFGRYPIPFQVVFRNDRWWNADTGEELEAYIAGWRLANDA